MPANKGTVIGAVIGLFFGVPLTGAAIGSWAASKYPKQFFRWLLTDDSATTNSDNQLETIPILSGAKNQSGYGKPVPIVLGEHRLTPYYCGSPYHTISGTDGETQTFHALYMLGYNDITIDDIKLGQTILAHNRNYTKKCTDNITVKAKTSVGLRYASTGRFYSCAVPGSSYSKYVITATPKITFSYEETQIQTEREVTGVSLYGVKYSIKRLVGSSATTIYETSATDYENIVSGSEITLAGTTYEVTPFTANEPVYAEIVIDHIVVSFDNGTTSTLYPDTRKWYATFRSSYSSSTTRYAATLQTNDDYSVYETVNEERMVSNVEDGNIAIDGRWDDDERDDGEKYNISLELRQGANAERDDGEVDLYPEKVIEEQLSIELIHTSDNVKTLVLERFSAKYPRMVELEFTMEGLISFDSNNKAQDATVSVQIEISFDGGDTYVPFNLTGLADNVEGATYNAVNGIFTITKQKNKVMRFHAFRELSYNEAINATNNVAELRIKRTNAQSSSTNTADKIYLTAVRTWCYDYKASTAEGVSTLIPQVPVITSLRNRTARLAFQIDANETDFQNQIDELNCIVRSKGKVFANGQWSTTKVVTSNPASLALNLLEHSSRGEYAYDGNKIDYSLFGELYEWANTPRTENDDTPKFQCNTVITTQKKTREIIDNILMTARAKLVLTDKKYGVWIDNPQTYPVMILNNQNVLSASNSKAFTKLPDGYKVKFINKNLGYQTDEIKVMFDQSQVDAPNKMFESIELMFQTDPKQVFQNAKYMLAVEKLRQEQWQRKVSIDGNLIDIGSLVEIQDDTISVGIGDGAEITEVIISGNNVTGIKTDGRFPVTDLTKTYAIKYTRANGTLAPMPVYQEVTISAAGIVSEFVFATPLSTSSENCPTVGDIVSFGEAEKVTTKALCMGKKDNGDGTFDLSFTPYQESIYTADDDDVSVDDLRFDSNVSDMPELSAGTHELKKVTYDELTSKIINWLGSFETAPENANENDAYCNLVDGCSYLYKNGEWGLMASAGMGISSIVKQYALSDSKTTAPTTGWSNNPSEVTSEYPYLWTKETVTYSDESTDTTDPIVMLVYNEPTIIYQAYTDTGICVKDTNGTITPASVNFVFRTLVGDTAESLTAYYKTYYSTDGTTYTEITGGSGSGIGATVTMQSTYKGIKIVLFDDDQYTNILAEQIVRVVENGIDGADGADGADGGYQDYAFTVGAFDLTDQQLRALTWYDTPPAITEQNPCLYIATKWIEGA